jgi:hypothetical protein
MNITAAKWAYEQEKKEAEALEKALNNIKPYAPADEIEQAFRQGMTAGKSTDKRLILIADHYGFTSQANMLCEEAAEFTVALNKLRRGHAEAYANIILLGENEIDEIIAEKVKRQLKRIEDEKTN